METNPLDILFLDIETVSQAKHFDELDDEMQVFWKKKAEQKFKDENKSPAELYVAKAAIYAEFAKVICVSFGYIKRDENHGYALCIKSIYGHDERALLLSVCEILSKHGMHSNKFLCAHNGREFDFPYLCRRMLINGIPLPELLQIQNKKPWEIRHFDTMSMWRFGDYKNFTSLDLLCKIFGIESPKGSIHGGDIHDYYWEKRDFKTIFEYCQSDVVAVTRLFLKMISSPIEIKNVEYID